MPIYKPGEKFRYHRILSQRGRKREVVALLSLTAMVDMFTVLVIFLLQNYNTTGEVLYIPKEVTLPKAQQIKELKPAHVVTVSNKEVLLDKNVVATYAEIKNQPEWLIQKLYTDLSAEIKEEEKKAKQGIQSKIKEAVRNKKEEDVNSWRKVTIQADKGVDFLTIKKVMYTVTEAGAGEINFAVMKLTEDKASQ